MRARVSRRALIIGMGGVGCPAAMALARAQTQIREAGGGVVLRLVDDDRVDVSNLHRQVLFLDEDAGRSKVSAAAQRLSEDWPGIAVEPRSARFDESTADALLDGVDVVIDGSDNFPSRFAVNDACVEAGVPLVHAAVLGWSGQVLTFDPGARGRGCYRCLFEAPPPADAVPTCARAGVLGPVAGVIGALAAAEALRLLVGRPPLHAQTLLTYESRADAFRSVRFNRRPDCTAHPDPTTRMTDP